METTAACGTKRMTWKQVRKFDNGTVLLIGGGELFEIFSRFSSQSLFLSYSLRS